MFTPIPDYKKVIPVIRKLKTAETKKFYPQ